MVLLQTVEVIWEEKIQNRFKSLHKIFISSQWGFYVTVAMQTAFMFFLSALLLQSITHALWK